MDKPQGWVSGFFRMASPPDGELVEKIPPKRTGAEGNENKRNQMKVVIFPSIYFFHMWSIFQSPRALRYYGSSDWLVFEFGKFALPLHKLVKKLTCFFLMPSLRSDPNLGSCLWWPFWLYPLWRLLCCWSALARHSAFILLPFLWSPWLVPLLRVCALVRLYACVGWCRALEIQIQEYFAGFVMKQLIQT